MEYSQIGKAFAFGAKIYRFKSYYSNISFMLYTPLEQFQIISLFSIKLFCLDFSITNLLFINIIVLTLFSIFVLLLCSNDKTFYLVPNNWQTLLESIFSTVSQLLFDNINEHLWHFRLSTDLHRFHGFFFDI